jgi:membrane-associated PAP2 superfamily phosphatase
VSIAIDIIGVVALIGLRKRIVPWLFWIALVVGLALFGIRSTGDAAWWTGHLTYSLN